MTTKCRECGFKIRNAKTHQDGEHHRNGHPRRGTVRPLDQNGNKKEHQFGAR